jgi:hypothetical protein
MFQIISMMTGVDLTIMPDSCYRASILRSLRMDPRLQLAGMTTGEIRHFLGVCPHVYAL